MVTEEAPKKSIARPGSETGVNSHVIRTCEGNTSGHHNVKWSSKPPDEDSSIALPSFEDEVVAWTGPSAIQSVTSDVDSRALR